MHAIQRNEDKTLQYIMKLIPDLTVFDIVEKECINRLESSEPVIYKLFYYDPAPSLYKLNDDIYKYVAKTDFKRAIFKFSFLEGNKGSDSSGPTTSEGQGVHIATEFCHNIKESEEFIDKFGYVINKETGFYIIHDKNHKVIENQTLNDIKFISIKAADSFYNSFIFNKENDRYLVIIDERGEANGEFSILINNYFNLENIINLQSVIGVCF